MTVHVLVADDQALIREGFRRAIDREYDLQVVAEATDGEHAIRLAHEHRPDVVVMDIRMPRLDGLTATERILQALPDTKVLVLTTFDVDEYLYRALRVGASGFVLKDIPLRDLAEAIRIVARGDALLAPAVTRRVIAHFTRQSHREQTATSPRLSQLSPREHDVLAVLVTGASNAEIAAQLHLSEATVKTHIRSMLTKLDLRDRTQLVIAAFDAGLD